MSARVVGVKGGRIMFKHILPNIVSPVIIYGTLMLGGGVTMTAGLSYLGASEHKLAEVRPGQVIQPRNRRKGRRVSKLKI